MFAHFNREKSAKCDNPSNPHTIMHLWAKPWNPSVVCLWAFAQAMNHAFKKIRSVESEDEMNLFGVSIRVSNQMPAADRFVKMILSH